MLAVNDNLYYRLSFILKTKLGTYDKCLILFLNEIFVESPNCPMNNYGYAARILSYKRKIIILSVILVHCLVLLAFTYCNNRLFFNYYLQY